MSNLIPLRSMTNLINRWPSFWDDEDLNFFSSIDNGIDLYETDHEIVVKANVAGVAPEEIDVTFEKGILWIKAQAAREEDDQKNKYYSKSSWNYSYKLAIPGMIDSSKEPELILDGGVLKVVFTKAEASQPKKLTVKTK